MSNTPSEELYWRLHSLSKILEGSGVIDESQHPDAYATILDAMAFVRGQQPVAREPLTDAQIKGLIEEGAFFGNCKEIVRAIEETHGIGIKGGQHGAE